MAKKLVLGLVPVALVLLAVLVGSGLVERTDVVLVGYALSTDGKTLTMEVGVPTSMGYVRGCRDAGGGVKPHYLHFYATFGGPNSALGARSRFTLDLGEEDSEVYFSRGGGGYALVLEKDDTTGEWRPPENAAP